MIKTVVYQYSVSGKGNFSGSPNEVQVTGDMHISHVAAIGPGVPSSPAPLYDFPFEITKFSLNVGGKLFTGKGALLIREVANSSYGIWNLNGTGAWTQWISEDVNNPLFYDAAGHPFNQQKHIHYTQLAPIIKMTNLAPNNTVPTPGNPQFMVQPFPAEGLQLMRTGFCFKE